MKIENVEYKDQKFINLNSYGDDYKNCIFKNVQFEECTFSHTIFEICVFTDCTFIDCSLSYKVQRSVYFTNCTFEKVKFLKCHIYGVWFRGEFRGEFRACTIESTKLPSNSMEETCKFLYNHITGCEVFENTHIVIFTNPYLVFVDGGKKLLKVGDKKRYDGRIVYGFEEFIRVQEGKETIGMDIANWHKRWIMERLDMILNAPRSSIGYSE